jgi:S-sulfosulfanyl-L-cysteine sulfohydrolase
VNKLREKADLVVILSHNGFDVDRKMASRVKGIDVILCAHTHDALPEPVKVGKTLLVASGSHGKYLSRLDLDVQNKEVKGFSYKLIPLFSDVITPDKEMKAAIDKSRAPYEAHLNEVVAKNDGVLYRRGNFNGTWDDLICDALIKERDSEISLSPGFRWGTSLLAGNITREDIYNNTAMTYPAAYRMEMSGQRLKDVLEDVADNIFNPDPYLQQGGDMVRVGGISYTIDVNKPIGSRISDMKSQKTGAALEASKNYTVSGWASVTEGIAGPPIWDVVTKYIAEKKTITPNDVSRVKVIQ